MASYLLIPNTNPTLHRARFVKSPSLPWKPISCFNSQSSPFLKIDSNSLESSNAQKRLINAIVLAHQISPSSSKRKKKKKSVEGEGEEQVGRSQMLGLCGFGYWMQGFRCFPWLALNFHMAQNLSFDPSLLQLVQNSANLPMVAKPLYGILSDPLYIGGAHRVPYISIGVILQAMSWGALALIPFASEALPAIMACVLLSNLGAALTEVAQDALVAEYGQKNKLFGLQSYTFMAIAVAGILGNSLGGFMLSKSHSRIVFSLFTALLLLHLSISSTIKEQSLGLSQPPVQIASTELSFVDNVKSQLSELSVALQDEKIFRPLIWVVASISVVPMLSGSIFCYQTQCLNLDPSIIGISRVVGQGLLLSLTLLYDRFWKKISIQELIGNVQLVYALSLLLDLVLVKQINHAVGIPNDVFALCFSGLAETISTFKTVPFYVLIASLCPVGCEASLVSVLASALCLSSVISGFLGIGLASVLGITSGNYTGLPVGIFIQFLAALLPLIWIDYLPVSETVFRKEMNKGMSRRSRRNRRVGKVVLKSIFFYRRGRIES
ncbi:hypothetical protein V2J09_017824 [Rumex salicifolius]